MMKDDKNSIKNSKKYNKIYQIDNQANNGQYWQGYGKMGTLIHCLWECKHAQCFGEAHFDFDILLLGNYLNRSKAI